MGEQFKGVTDVSISLPAEDSEASFRVTIVNDDSNLESYDVLSPPILNLRIKETTFNWIKKAACEGMTDLFYPPLAKRADRREQNEKKPKAICRICEVQSECLESALANNEDDGIWGGTNAEERKAILKRRTMRRTAG